HAANLRVLAFRVLADDGEVDRARRLVGKRSAHAGVEHGRPYARVLIESSTDRQQQAVQRDVVLQARIADRAEEDRVERTQPIERIAGHHLPAREVVLGAPRERLPGEPHTRALARGLEHAYGRGDHFGADAVTGNHCDTVVIHSDHHSFRAEESLRGLTTNRADATTESRRAARSPDPRAKSGIPAASTGQA